MTIIFYDHDSHVCFSFEDERSKLDHLPAAIYRLRVKDTPAGRSLHLLKDVKQFIIPERRFGSHERNVRTILNDYDRVNPPLGVMAIGTKGSGKSLLCEDLCNRLLAKGLPIIIVDQAIDQQGLLIAATAIGPAVFYFDEIGKMYSARDRDDGNNTSLNQLLPFFSNQNLIGRVFLITANGTEELNQFILDRPGRFKYRLNMHAMEREAYLEYLRAHHVPDTKITWLENNWTSYSFDQLRALIPILKGASDPIDFWKQLEILNVWRPMVSTVFINSVHYQGTPYTVGNRNAASVCFEGADIAVTLEDKAFRIPWRNEDGTICDYLHPNLEWGGSGNEYEVDDYTFTLSMSGRAYRPQAGDLLENTLLSKRPRMTIGLTKPPQKEDDSQDKDQSESEATLSDVAGVGRGRMSALFTLRGEQNDLVTVG